MWACGYVWVASHYNSVCVTVEQAYFVYTTVQYWFDINMPALIGEVQIGPPIYPVPYRYASSFLYAGPKNSTASAKEPERRAVAGTGGPVGSRGGPSPPAQDRATGG
jgi:hypothetical protein